MTVAINNNRIDISRVVLAADLAAGDVQLQLAMLRAQTNDDAFQRRTAMSAGNDGDIPAVGTLPAPSLTANVTTGPGLETNPAGWPAGSVRDAAGWVVVPEGGTNWSIYSPDQKMGETPYTRVWGDPHMTEGDGTRSDFSGHALLKIPSGTNILCEVSNGGRGQSVSQKLTIVNDNSSVTITGVDGTPTTSAVSATGFADRAAMLQKAQVTLVAGGDHSAGADADRRVMWAREGADGKIEGVVTGSTQKGDGDYDQVIDGTKPFLVDPSLRPDPAKEPEIFAKFLRGTMLDMAVRMEPSLLDGAVAMAVNDSNIKNSTPGYWEQYLASSDGQLAQTLRADDWLSPIDGFDAEFGKGTTEMASGFMLWAMDRAAQEGLNEQMRRLQMARQG